MQLTASTQCSFISDFDLIVLGVLDCKLAFQEWGQAVEICKGSQLEGLYVEVMLSNERDMFSERLVFLGMVG